MIERVSIPLQQIDPDLPVPAYAYVGDAGVDLRATCDDILKPFERKLVPCGIAVAIPSGYAGFVLPRSGLAIKHGVSLVNAPGLIDSNYRGEIQAILVTIRYYDKCGFCPELARDARGVRTFSQSDVAQLYFVDALRKSGLSIEGIQYYVKLQRRGAATRDERLAIVRAQETVLEYQRAELDESLKRLSAAGVELSTDRKSR